MGRVLFVVAVLAAAPVAARVQSRPTDPPLVTAENESWYRLGEPVQFAGDLYYLAGPAVFFNGNTMVRVGHYNGVPLYADTTVEPFSILLVPISRGLMQPYERLRRGELAGTTGSRPPSFPVRATPDRARPPMAAVSPTAPPLPTGAISVFTPEVAATTGVLARPDCPPAAPGLVAADPGGARAMRSDAIPDVTGMTGARPADVPQERRPIVSLRRPESNDGIWVRFHGAKWVSAGPAVPLTAADFVRVGAHAGFPVFARRDGPGDVIYLPTRAGLVAPYRLKTP